MSTIDTAVIGCSAGGLSALQQILAFLHPDLGIAIADAGGICLVQTRATAVADAMPRAALLAVPEAKVVRLETIAGELDLLCR